jgi:hypothetical protein
MPLDLDEAGERLNAELAQCERERGVAEDKLTNPRRSMLYPRYVALRKAADAIREGCDRIWFKIRIHRSAKRDKAELPPY